MSGHGFYIKCYCYLDLWHSDLKSYGGHLLIMTNLPNKYHDCHSETFQDIERTYFYFKCYCDLDVWPTDLLTMTNLPTFKILSGHGFCIKCYCDLDLWHTFVVTSTVIVDIYWPWPIVLPSTMTVTQKLFKILSGHDVANGRTDGRTDAIP